MNRELAGALRFFLLVVGTLVILLASVFVSMLPYDRSPLRLIDPSGGPPDSALCEALERALNGGVDPPARVGRFVGDVALPLGAMTESEFRERVATVPGWEQLVLYPPYKRGEELPLDPAISSWWLKRRIRGTDGCSVERVFYVLVIRDQKMVGSLILGTELEVAGIISRPP